MRTIWNYLLVTIFMIGCQLPERHGKSPIVMDYQLTDSCNMYVLNYSFEEPLQKFGLSGPCNNLKAEDYIKGVRSHFDSTKFDWNDYNGQLVFEYYEFEDNYKIPKELKLILPNSSIESNSSTMVTFLSKRK